MRERLVIPEAGDVCFQPGLIPTGLAIRSSMDVNTDLGLSGTRHYLTHSAGQEVDMLRDIAPYDSNSNIAEKLRDTAYLARRELYLRVLDGLDLNWREIIGYARIMSEAGGPKGGLSLHTDYAQDIRVLVNAGGTGFWWFAGKHKAQYPDGIFLNPGDVATINNHCIPDEQVQHGARLAPGVPIRTSFLFHIHEIPYSNN